MKKCKKRERSKKTEAKKIRASKKENETVNGHNQFKELWGPIGNFFVGTHIHSHNNTDINIVYYKFIIKQKVIKMNLNTLFNSNKNIFKISTVKTNNFFL